MKVALLVVSATFIGTLAASSICATLLAQAPVDLTGTWTGTSSDLWTNRQDLTNPDGMAVTWVVTQNNDSTISGTVTTGGVNGNDGTCSGCHRQRSGTVTGSISGTALTLRLDLPGHSEDLSPICNATFSVTAPATISSTIPSITSQPASQSIAMGRPATLTVAGTASDQANVQYTGSDSCEGTFAQGVLPMTRPGAQLSYQWYAGMSGTTSNPIAGANASSYATTAITAVTTLWVRVANAVGGTVDSATATLTPYQPFTDDVLSAGTSVIKAAHILELRTRIDALRLRFGLAAYPYTDAILTAGATSIQVQHIVDLRAALAGAYMVAGRALPVYTDPSLSAGVVIKRAHVDELRSAVESIE